jgi:aryl-alcohol dehydrogenase-like predicted oxidoreductase
MDADQLRRAHAVHPVAALQIEYSLATRFIEARILPTARELGVGVVAYGALSRGLLTGTVRAGLDPRDFRAHLPRFTGENLARNLERVDALAALAHRLGATPAQLALAWVLSRGDDIVALVGTTRRARLAEDLGALDLRLTPADLAELDAMFPPGAISGERYPAPQMRIVAR